MYIIGACGKDYHVHVKYLSLTPGVAVGIYTEESKEGTVYLESEMLVCVCHCSPLSLSLYIYLSACVFVHVPKIAFTTCVMISG